GVETVEGLTTSTVEDDERLPGDHGDGGQSSLERLRAQRDRRKRLQPRKVDLPALLAALRDRRRGTAHVVDVDITVIEGARSAERIAELADRYAPVAFSGRRPSRRPIRRPI